MRKIVGSEIILQLIEVNHIVNEYASVSDEHNNLKQAWMRIIKNEPLGVGNRFKMKDFLDFASKILWNHFHEGPPSAKNVRIQPPESLQSLQTLRLVCKQFSEKDISPEQPSTSEVKSVLVPISQSTLDEPERFVLTGADKSEFLQFFLTEANRIPESTLKTRKKEFFGAISSNNYQLYPNLKIGTSEAT
ncbi:hypothetical protein Ciccas_004639 [Cichlidogyrus casuarinus]|uniref:Uncharacterized protein n=1 Tax=Cichlidogyrus casuarinus TaxID=1844966 RepID=A0ABD2QAY1_9PLAT